MTKRSRKDQGSPSSRSKHRAQTLSSTTSNDDKTASQVATPAAEVPMSVEDASENAAVNDETTVAEPLSEIVSSSDEPTLTELIVDRFDGEKNNGRFEGFGKAYFINGNTYEGVFSEGMMHGQGNFYWLTENILYEGDFQFNEITGNGKYMWSDGSTYEGQVYKGIRHGKGYYCHSSGKSYEGEWFMGKRNGYGRIDYDKNKLSYYEGMWSNNVIEGEGFRQYGSGNWYKGDWWKGKRHGQGTMKWLDRNEEYTGQWKNGVQNGNGIHIWTAQRIKGSQYSMRNMYCGEFVNGKREGFGDFHYASGSHYSGTWFNNKKNGKGVFVFKNGTQFEGEFEEDKIKEFPDISLSGRLTPDIPAEKMQKMMEMDVETMSARWSQSSLNTTSPGFQLFIHHLLDDARISNPEEESIQIHKAVLLHIVALRKIYQFYSRLGEDESGDNTCIMKQLQFWRLLKDCKFHFNRGPTLADFDRIIVPSDGSNSEIHSPEKTLLFYGFLNYLISIAFDLYSQLYIDFYEDFSGQLISNCFVKMLTDNIFPNACVVGGRLFLDPTRTQYVMKYLPKLKLLYFNICTPKTEMKDLSMKMRDCLIMMKKLNLLNDRLTAKDIVDIFAYDDPNVTDGQFVYLEIEITFYEFLEVITESATKFITKEIINQWWPITMKEEIKQEILPLDSLAGTFISGAGDDLSEVDIPLSIGGAAGGPQSRPLTAEFTGQQQIVSSDMVGATTGQINQNQLESTIDQSDGISQQRSSIKPLSSKIKPPSGDSSRNRKTEPEKGSPSRKTHKSNKSQKSTFSKGVKTSTDTDSIMATKNEPENLIPEIYGIDDEVIDQTVLSERQEDSEMITEREFETWTQKITIFLDHYLFKNYLYFMSLDKRRIEAEQEAAAAANIGIETSSDGDIEKDCTNQQQQLNISDGNLPTNIQMITATDAAIKFDAVPMSPYQDLSIIKEEMSYEIDDMGVKVTSG